MIYLGKNFSGCTTFSDDGEEIIVPEILQLPRRMVPMLPSLWSDTTCEYTAGLHKLVEEKFQTIAHHWFQPVPSMPDYFFFSPEAQQRGSRVSFVSVVVEQIRLGMRRNNARDEKKQCHEAFCL